MKHVRILHTADWHLGKIVNDYSMIADQRYYLNKLIDQVKHMQLDAFIVAGDLYDRSLPPKEAVALADEILTRIIEELQIPVLVTSGNHDSSERLEYGSRLLTKNQLYIEGTVKETTRKVTIQDTNFYLIPFTEPVLMRQLVQDDQIKTIEDVTRYQINKIKENLDPTKVNILIAHGYVINGTPDSVEDSDSERPLNIGTVEYIPSELLEDFDYVALGHLHKPQKVKHDKIRYSGSLLKYSKSEAMHQKKSPIIDITKDSLEINYVSVDHLHDMRIIKGTFSELIKGSSTDYIFFELEDEGIILDPMNQLRRRYPNTMGLEYRNRQESISSKLKHNQSDLEKLSFTDLFTDFYQDYTQSTLTDDDLTIINEAFEVAERTHNETHKA